MSNSCNRDDDTEDKFGFAHRDLEQLIFSARDYVVPTEDHRPRTIEAAREAWWERRHVRHVGLAALTCAATWLMSLSLIDMGNVLREHLMSRSAQFPVLFLHQHQGSQGLVSDWDLVKAMDRWGSLGIQEGELEQRRIATEDQKAGSGSRD